MLQDTAVFFAKRIISDDVLKKFYTAPITTMQGDQTLKLLHNVLMVIGTKICDMCLITIIYVSLLYILM